MTTPTEPEYRIVSGEDAINLYLMAAEKAESELASSRASNRRLLWRAYRAETRLARLRVQLAESRRFNQTLATALFFLFASYLVLAAVAVGR